MTARKPWLATTGAATTPYHVALPRTPVPLPPPTERWLAADPAAPAIAPAATPGPAPAEPEAAACAGCAELASTRAGLAAARDEAIAAGRREGREETAAARERLAAAAAAFDRARAARTDAVTEQIVDVALGLCAELAPAAAVIDRRALVQLIARSLAEAGGARDLAVQMCAEDAAAIGTELPAGMACTVRADLVPGEVWVDAPRLVIDGRWATRLAALREPLLALIHAAEPSFELAGDAREAARAD